ncbi:hypothetical protein AB205_0034360, partial [Aquarana catesbeiana]
QNHIREYGRIFKSHFGPQFVVSIADRDMVAQILRAERDAPQRANMESWQEYRDLRGRSTGLISAEGKKWLAMRSVLRQKILRPRDVFIYAGGVNEVVSDLIKRIRTLRSREDDGETVTNVNDLYFKYSMEGLWMGGIYLGQIHVDGRLREIQACLDRGEEVKGGLLTSILISKELTLEELYANMTEMLLAGVDTNEVPKQTLEYIEALELMFSMFKTTMYAGAIPKWLRPFIPKPWEEFCRSWDGLFRFNFRRTCGRNAADFLTNGLAYIRSHKSGFTSFTLSWATYLLAKNPQAQQMVYDQIVQNLGKDTVPTAEDVPKLPLIRAVLKETLRYINVRCS